MAVFLINICKFNGCGITFPSLGDLIQHIEDTHIDYDPQVIEQKEQSQPSCLPLSYVLRFITDAARKEGPFLGTSGAELKRKLAIKHHSYSMSSSNRSNTPTDIGSEMDEDEMMVSESEDSNDSWTTEEFSSEFIMRYGSRHSGSLGNSASNEKPFACPVPGCKKRYKNVNGIKYHSKNGHKKDGKVRKGFKCHCGKSYKTSQGLKSHSLIAHNTTIAGGGSVTTVTPAHSTTTITTTVTTPPSPVGLLAATVSTTSMGNGNTSSIVGGKNNSSTNILNEQTFSNQSIGLITNSTANQHTISANVVNNNITSCSNNINKNNNNNNNHNFNNQNQLSPNSQQTKQNFGLISIKAKGSSNIVNNSNNNNNTISTTISAPLVISSSASTAPLSSLSPSSKLVKLMTDQNDKLIDGNGVKMNLPSLVNLGILTPATSPKQQQLLQQHQQQQFTHQINHNTNSNNNSNNNNSNNDILPLTPISPNMTRNMNFNNHLTTVTTTTTTNANTNSIVDAIMTDET